MRDALSILDKIVSFTGGTVSYDNTVEHLNILDADYYFKLLDCMLTQDLAGAMLLYDDINNKGFEGDAVLNGFAETLRNVLICKDERVASLLEVVESFKQRYQEAARRCDVGYLVSALNIISEAEISYKTARNKRLQVELALIKLCYLQQALQLTDDNNSIGKKKRVEGAALQFKNIPPLAVKNNAAETLPQAKAKLTIYTGPEQMVQEPEGSEAPQAAPPPKKIPPPPAVITAASTPTPAATATAAPSKTPKLGSLKRIQQLVAGDECAQQEVSQPLEQSSLESAWKAFIEELKGAKNPAWQSFDLAQLRITAPDAFEATATNNLQQKFLELERNKAAEFLQTKLCNKTLQFSVVLIDVPQEHLTVNLPLSSKDQYLKLAEQYPMLKELKEKLRLEIDY